MTKLTYGPDETRMNRLEASSASKVCLGDILNDYRTRRSWDEARLADYLGTDRPTLGGLFRTPLPIGYEAVTTIAST